MGSQKLTASYVKRHEARRLSNLFPILRRSAPFSATIEGKPERAPPRYNCI
jgi:hypothetical protein